ncbi:Alpha-1,3-mannosyltransferase-like protein [Tilletia horrida]|nr:Alpha-1,3-mannosyltransferase-like protein [Tilletia horrida]
MSALLSTTIEVTMSAHDSTADGLMPAERRASGASAETHSSGGHTERGSAPATLLGHASAAQEVPQSGLRQRLADASNAATDQVDDAAPSPFGEARKKLRIGFIHPDLGIGGAERLVVDAALGLQARGHDVSIFTSHHDPKHCFEPTRDGTLKVYHMRTKIPRSLPPFHAFHLPLAILQQLSLVVQLVIALALTRYPWLERVPLLASATAIQKADASSAGDPPETPAGTPPLPLPAFDLFIFDQLPVGIPLLRLGSGTRAAYYCHFPDKEIARALDRQAHVNARSMKQKAVLAVKTALKKVYRAPFDLLEEATTDCADRLMVNSYYTASYFLHSFPIIASRLTREATALRQVQVRPGVGSAPKVVYPAVDASEFTSAWVATELKRLEDADRRAKERASAANAAPPGTLAVKEKAKLAKEGSRGVLEVRKAIRDLCTTNERPTFVSINRFEAKKNIALAVASFAELIQPELEATKEAQSVFRPNSSFSLAASGNRSGSLDPASPTSTPAGSSTPAGGDDRVGGRSLRIDTSSRDQLSPSAPSSRSSSTASFARFAQLNQMSRMTKSSRGSGGLRLVVAGGYDRRVLDNISTLQALQDQCDKLGLRHITLSYNPQPFEPPVSPPVPDELTAAHVIFLQSAPVGCLRALLTNESTIGLVYTPAGEHFGIVPLEAAACGLPVLAVNDGGPRESIVDGQVVRVKKSTSTGSFPSSSSTSTVRNQRFPESRPGTAKGSDQKTPRGSMTGSRPMFNIGDDVDPLNNIQPVTLADNDEEEEGGAAASGSGVPALAGAPLVDDRQRRRILVACLKRAEGEAPEEWTNADGTGLLRANNTDAFAAGMRSLLALWLEEDDSKARKRVAAAAQRRVSEHFGLEVLSQRLEEVALQCVRMGPISSLQLLAPLLASLAMLITGAVIYVLLDIKKTGLAKEAASMVTSAVSKTSTPTPIASHVQTAVSSVVTSAVEAAAVATAAATSVVAETVADAGHVEL